MSTTRPSPAGDCGPEPEGAAASAAAPEAGAAVAPGAATCPEAEVGADAGADAGRASGESTGESTGEDSPESSAEEYAMRQVRRLRLVGSGGAVPRARDFVRQALTDWGWLPAATGDQRAAAEDVLLVASELVTNACLHADGPDELRVGSGAKVVRLEIVDLGSGAPSPRTPHRAGRPGGHGMFIVQRLCLDWGVVRNPEGRGKTVWAELAAPS